MRMNQNLLITDFLPEHLNDIKNILKENFNNPWSEDQILSSNSFSVKKILMIDEEVAGFFSGEIIFSEGSITMIALKKSFQGKGLGNFILGWFFSLCSKKGVKNIWLEVSVKNKKAIRFYEKHGFFIEDIRKNYYKDGSDAFIMRKPLYP